MCMLVPGHRKKRVPYSGHAKLVIIDHSIPEEMAGFQRQMRSMVLDHLRFPCHTSRNPSMAKVLNLSIEPKTSYRKRGALCIQMDVLNLT
ncbi:hypothetical protein Hypma_011774 [Hypsizygus marmoreus]|uniref:Uncharacterized protein n=1 Tax=Hypsizygus marmoreus TaxID=39966 RepID=A0A369JQX3_HYPMA|nr:hypothetical protein Hypma_011774 [Hypsizygus marmoreus]